MSAAGSNGGAGGMAAYANAGAHAQRYPQPPLLMVSRRCIFFASMASIIDFVSVCVRAQSAE
jgi:hypothetical protein